MARVTCEFNIEMEAAREPSHEDSRAALCLQEFVSFVQRTLFPSVNEKEGSRPLAVAFGAALLGFGSVGFEIRLLRVSGLTVRKIAFQMLKA